MMTTRRDDGAINWKAIGVFLSAAGLAFSVLLTVVGGIVYIYKMESRLSTHTNTKVKEVGDSLKDEIQDQYADLNDRFDIYESKSEQQYLRMESRMDRLEASFTESTFDRRLLEERTKDRFYASQFRQWTSILFARNPSLTPVSADEVLGPINPWSAMESAATGFYHSIIPAEPTQ